MSTQSNFLSAATSYRNSTKFGLGLVASIIFWRDNVCCTDSGHRKAVKCKGHGFFCGQYITVVPIYVWQSQGPSEEIVRVHCMKQWRWSWVAFETTGCWDTQAMRHLSWRAAYGEQNLQTSRIYENLQDVVWYVGHILIIKLAWSQRAEIAIGWQKNT